MKQLVILRHAKTERNHPDGDRTRRLTARGERDARSAASAIRDAVGSVDAIVVSNAARAVQTAELAADEIGFEGSVQELPQIYLAGVSDLVRVVHALPATAATVVLIGHNPGFLDLINWFAGNSHSRDHLPTAAFAIVSCPVDSWALFAPPNTAVSPVVAP